MSVALEVNGGELGRDVAYLNLDVDLLRQQRDWLQSVELTSDKAEGLLNLVDRLIDIAEGYA